MQTDHRARLANIRTFPSLVAYLRDEMGWPIGTEDFEDLTFDYSADELGIDLKNAAKIQEIKRLRPLSTLQPWGIFFVKFEPKRLPVVALRRILSHVVVKKRAHGSSAERAAWAADDLLFISNYGEGEERKITFAHFSKPQDGHDLPTLKVLGWDNLDTALHLDAVAEELTSHLAWPGDEGDVEAWRNSWRSAFTLRHGEVIRTSRDLSIGLAELARAIRDRIKTALAIENETGPLTTLMTAFQQALVHDLEADGFADMYAQTIAYGLLSARIADPERVSVDDLATHMRTNPFLRELMETFLKVGGRRGKAAGAGIDFDELGVSDVVELLDRANMEKVVEDFGDRNPQEDPVIHFYELFLKEYDARKRMQRGVFYTPRPVVSYIVRSVDELLRTEFGLEDGLADTTTWGEMARRNMGLKIPDGVSADQDFVQILDPACGTGTFLVEVVDVIYKTLVAKWEKEAGGPLLADVDRRWNQYVAEHLLPRLHGYELLMAPYAIAHLKIGLKLHETGYRFASDERVKVYLTNALEPASDVRQMKLEGIAPALAHEAEAVNEVKSKQRFTVVVGNPPYANYSANLTEQARRLVDKYRTFRNAPIRERNQLQFERNLQDDFVKFVSIAEGQIEKSRMGVLGLITNATMLASPSLRGMREHLMRAFSSLHELNLHGGVNEIAQESEGDQNVFEIAQAVAIHAYFRGPGSSRGYVLFSELWGSRHQKNSFLASCSVGTTTWQPVSPDVETCAFVPQGSVENSAVVRLSDVFERFGAGVKTNRDAVAIAHSKRELDEALHAFSPRLASGSGSDKFIQPILYRPFDERFIFYHEDVVASRSLPTMQHMLAGANIGLLASSVWTSPDRFSVNVSRCLVEMKTGTHDRGTTLFPLFRYEAVVGHAAAKIPNLSAQFVARWGLIADVAGVVRPVHPHKNEAEIAAIVAWIYGICHSPRYRRHYRSLLAQGFPIVLFPGHRSTLAEVARLGAELIALHLLESPAVERFMTTYIGPRNPAVTRVGWSDDTVWLDAAATKKGQPAKPGTIGFRGVPEAVWQFHIGGYQVCEKWLKDRKGRTLSDDDIAHYQKVVVALNETIRLMQEIDEVIEAHGGWPGAFQTKPETAAAPAPTPTPFSPRRVEPRPENRYVTCVPLYPLKAAAGAFSDPQHVEDDDLEWVEVQSQRRPRKGLFVAQVVGHSMEPSIPDGAYCLFASPVEGFRQGKTVLVQLRDATDPETGERYTVKRYESEKTADGDSWRHTRVTLKPVNPDFSPIILTGAPDEQLQVVAELVEVLGPPSTQADTEPPSPPDDEEAEPLVDEEAEPPVDEEAEPPAPHADPNDLDRDELMGMIRALFADGAEREREAAIDTLARELGYQRTGTLIHEELDNALRTAVRRGVLASERGVLRLLARNIDGYARDFLKDQLLASLGGRQWVEREDAIRGLRRWLGFRRTGSTIVDTAKSLINGLLREGRLEASGSLIRRTG